MSFTAPPVPTFITLEMTVCPMDKCPADFNSDGALEKFTLLGIKVNKNDNFHLTQHTHLKMFSGSGGNSSWWGKKDTGIEVKDQSVNEFRAYWVLVPVNVVAIKQLSTPEARREYHLNELRNMAKQIVSKLFEEFQKVYPATTCELPTDYTILTSKFPVLPQNQSVWVNAVKRTLPIVRKLLATPTVKVEATAPQEQFQLADADAERAFCQTAKACDLFGDAPPDHTSPEAQAPPRERQDYNVVSMQADPHPGLQSEHVGESREDSSDPTFKTASLEQMIAGLAKTMAVVNEKQDTLANGLTAMKTDLASMQAQVNTLDSKVTQWDEENHEYAETGDDWHDDWDEQYDHAGAAQSSTTPMTPPTTKSKKKAKSAKRQRTIQE